MIGSFEEAPVPLMIGALEEVPSGLYSGQFAWWNSEDEVFF